jgi:hypothetical protein
MQRLSSRPVLNRSKNKLKVYSFAPPGICFDQSCQQATDRIFLAAIGLPLLGLAAATSLTFLRQPDPIGDNDNIFEDPDTGAIFSSADGIQPERDQRGSLAFRAIGFTPWPAEKDTNNEKIRLLVGPVSSDAATLTKQYRTYAFSKLQSTSKIILITLPRPLGIIFQEDPKTSRIFIAQLIPGSNADQLHKTCKLSGSLDKAPAPGDILRAVTCTNIVYRAGALLFGAQKPGREIVVFGADDAGREGNPPLPVPKVFGALKMGLIEDGEVQVVLERTAVYEAK